MRYPLTWLIISFLLVVETKGCVQRDLLSLESSLPSNQPYRTAYHFQPPKNWMNETNVFDFSLLSFHVLANNLGFSDPNGPMVYKGIYHLFYQYNPQGPIWGNIVWAHSTSKDLINWTPHPIAIYPTTNQSDINGCWSGSTTILPGGKPAILYTGMNSKNQQVQNLATPKNLSDPHLIEWTKSPYNPLISPTSGNYKIDPSSFRDPTTAWLGQDGYWRVIIGNQRENSGMALLYRSKDFVEWRKAKSPLYTTKDSGMWECPDFYPVFSSGDDGVETSRFGDGIKHVLKASLGIGGLHDSYAIGRYGVEKDVFVPEKGSFGVGLEMRYDYGKFYASKTFFDSLKNRRVLWGWINESTNSTIDVVKGWSGLQSLPRKVWLDKSGGQLLQWPVKEIEKLRTKRVSFPSRKLKSGSILEVSGVTASQADVEISFEITNFTKAEELDPSRADPRAICGQKNGSVMGRLGPFGLLVLASKDIQEYTAVFFRIFRSKSRYVVLMCSDQSRSSLHLDYDKTTYGAFLDVDPMKEKLHLRSLIDHSIVESFGGEGKACITARVYPSFAINEAAHLYAFNNGTDNIKISKLIAWTMKKAKIN